MCSNYETIYSLWVAVVRVSGKQSVPSLIKITNRKKFQPRHVYLHTFLNPKSKENIDKGLVVYFSEPNSFTGEDCVEFHVHGSKAVIKALLQALHDCQLEDMRPALPGEYSKRAFLNGKMDLTEVEGLGDLINSETEQQRKLALRQMSGFVSNLYNKWRHQIIQATALINAYIDFEEEELDVNMGIIEVYSIIESLSNELFQHLSDKHYGERMRDGIKIVIAGPPNSGKSSLNNLLTRRSASIVTAIPGTTRDVIESFLDMDGYPVVLSDTAGIRSTDDLIEQEGIQRTIKELHSCDIRIFIFDVNELTLMDPTDAEKKIKDFQASNIKDDCSIDSHDIIVLNKTDLVQSNHDKISNIEKLVSFIFPRTSRVLMSCLNNEKVSVLMTKLTELIHERYDASDYGPTQTRHRIHLEKCYESLKRALELSDVVLISEELCSASREIEYITGRISLDDVLDQIFSQFCIGK